jgi:hypothetical protein
MSLDPVPHAQLLAEGVYRLPVLGPGGEIVVVAVDKTHRLTPSSPCLVPKDADPEETIARLRVELECAGGSHVRKGRKSATRGLEEWLRADIAGTVRGVQGGDAAIPDDQWARLAAAAEARRKRLEKEQRGE